MEAELGLGPSSQPSWLGGTAEPPLAFDVALRHGNRPERYIARASQSHETMATEGGAPVEVAVVAQDVAEKRALVAARVARIDADLGAVAQGRLATKDGAGWRPSWLPRGALALTFFTIFVAVIFSTIT